MTDMPKKLEVARIRVCFSEPFFGSFMYSIPCEMFSEDMEKSMKAAGMTPTMATDGKRILFSREWVEARTVPEIEGVLIHEIWHVVLKHHLRYDKLCSLKEIGKGDLSKQASSRRWNSAADYVINPMVLEDNKTLPAGGLVETRFRNHSTEQVYAILDEEAGKGGGKGGGNQGQDWGQVISLDDLSDSQVRELENEIETQVRQAAMTAKARGKVPSAVEKLIKDWDEAKIDWKTRLWRACDSFGGRMEDETWAWPNRRYIQNGMYLPSIVEYGPGTVVVAADSSGSVSDGEFKAMLSELSSIVTDTCPEKVIFMECDASIPKEHPITIEDGDFPAEYTRRRSGGTSFQPPFDWIKKEGIIPQYMIYLTDGECNFPDDPGYPVIWVITSKGIEAPWGTTIHLEV